MNNNQNTATTTDSDNPSIVDILIARQTAKRERITTIKQSMNAKHNEQTSFYFLMFKGGFFFFLIVLLGCLVADASAKHKSQSQLETEAVIQQLEKGEAVEMSVRVGAKP